MHNIEYYDYPEKINKNSVQAKLNNYVEQATWAEGGSVLQNIRWIDYICDNKEEAEQYIESHDKHWYDQLAVKYKVYKIKETAAYKKLIERRAETYSKLNSLERKVHYKDVKSSFVSCKKCGSKLSTKYIRSNYCPLCGEDIRPASTLDTIKRYKEKINELDKKIKQERKTLEKKAEKSATIRWLVKIEYHT